ncbi:MAG: bacillithiol biosynthesis deacetylase BshB1 [Acidobacteriota bacterium]
MGAEHEQEAVDVLAIGAHPDDVELAAGGTVAKLVAAGRRVGIVHLTRGEAGTRGTVEERRAEAEGAAEVLGASHLDILDCGDAGLRTGRAEEDTLLALLRRRRPELVLAPPPSDRHPDHGRAHRLVVDACFYAGLRGRARGRGGEAHRPGAVVCYMQHDLFTPSFIVDVGAWWQAKLDALACYRSQLHQRGDARRDEPETKVASPEFRDAIDGRARHFGQLIGAELGEPFWSRGPLAIADPLTLVPGGHR